uniref:Replication protein A subunit n=1 Tax=Timema poppense TaxID=170557 RepID=A0A7R9GTN8_TIMPO|nr:unnamed protein product [Timema poppensis]
MINNAGKGDKRVMIIMDLTVLTPGSQVRSQIGNPIPYTEGANNPTGFVQESQRYRVRSENLTHQPARKEMYNNGQMSVTGSGMTSYPFEGMKTQPLSSVNPYHTSLTLRSRVTLKTPIKTWNNTRGSGKLFSFSLVDESGEIRATGFNEQVDQFYDILEEGKVYYISEFIVKPANKSFSNIKHDFEITLSKSTSIAPCHDEKDIPFTRFNFLLINTLSEVDINSIVDVIGVCKNVGDVVMFTSKTTNTELKKREITLVDHSNTAVNVTLWGEQAEQFDGSLQPIVAIKGGRMTEFRGARSISPMTTSIVQVNPDIADAQRLRGWFDNFGSRLKTKSISTRCDLVGEGFSGNWMTLQEARQAQLGTSDKPDYFTCKAMVTMIRSENVVYKACPNGDCNKKVIDLGNNLYRCEKCNCEYPNYQYRLLIGVCLADWSTSLWVTCFNDVAQEILGATAQEVGLSENNNRFLYESYFRKPLFNNFIFRLCAKTEAYNDEKRLKFTIAKVMAIDFKKYSKCLLGSIKSILGLKIH